MEHCTWTWTWTRTRSKNARLHPCFSLLFCHTHRGYEEFVNACIELVHSGVCSCHGRMLCCSANSTYSSSHSSSSSSQICKSPQGCHRFIIIKDRHLRQIRLEKEGSKWPWIGTMQERRFQKFRYGVPVH